MGDGFTQGYYDVRYCNILHDSSACSKMSGGHSMRVELLRSPVTDRFVTPTIAFTGWHPARHRRLRMMSESVSEQDRVMSIYGEYSMTAYAAASLRPSIAAVLWSQCGRAAASRRLASQTDEIIEY